MNTVITKSNEVRVYDLDYAFLAISDIGDCIVITDSGEIIVNQGNPITWPADATDGMQAIVDVKAGTLRFAYDGWSRAHTEFVVSEYVEPVTSAPHVLDLIKEWPTDGTRPAVLVSPPGFSWRHHDEGDWSICGMNGDSEFFEGDWLNYHENKKKQVAPHIFDSIEWWPVAKNHPTPILPDGFIWVWQFSEWVISNGTVVLYNKDYRKQKYNEEKPDSGGLLGTKHDHGKPILGAVPPHAELAVESVAPVVSVEDRPEPVRHDPVNSPSHYTDGGIECIDAIKASMSTEAFLGFLKGNVQKYMWRYEKKVAPVEDLKKAQWYLSKLIEEQFS